MNKKKKEGNEKEKLLKNSKERDVGSRDKRKYIG